MNTFFANVGRNLASKTSSNNTNLHVYRVTPTISNISPNIKTFAKSFTSAVKIDKSCGPDEITAKELLINTEVSISGLYTILKKSIETETFPNKWKTAKVTCVHKKGSKKECTNYRPISLLSIPSKVIEHFTSLTMKYHLESLNLLSEFQWGFRKQRSTEDLLLHMTERWLRALDEGKSVAVLFIDYQKAFDTVSHPILLKKLAACGISGSLLAFMQSYLSERKQYTVVNNVQSEIETVDYGVPQGSLLGPNCFSININDMPNEMVNNDQDGEINLFADDSTAFTIANTVDDAISNMITTAENISEYSHRNSLTIHPEKCKLMVLSKERTFGPRQTIKINGKYIDTVENYKCLGITLDNNLSYEAHISNICKFFSAKVKKLYNMRSMSTETLKTIYFQGILPSVLYGILIWGCSNLSNINTIHIRAARFIMKIKKNTSDAEVLRIANWKPMEFYYKKSIACKCYKIYNNLSPPLLQNLIEKSETRSTRNQFKLDCPTLQ